MENNNFFTTIREVAQNNNPAITDAEKKGINNTVSTLEEQTKQLFEAPQNSSEKNKEEVVVVKETKVTVKDKKIFGLKPIPLLLTAIAVGIAGYYTIKYFKNKPVALVAPVAPINPI